MTDHQSRVSNDESLLDTLDMVPRRLSKFTLFWYLKSVPALTLGTIATIIPVVIGALLTIGLVIDWIVHRAFTDAQIDEALYYDYNSIDDAKMQQWINDPRLAEWVSKISIWVFVLPVLAVFALIIGWFIIRTLQWRRIRFGVEDGIVWMSGGLFVAWTRRLPIVHVQTVEFRSTILQRMLTLRGVSISSAAPEGKNATIELLAVRRGVAAELASTIQTAFGSVIATPEAGADNTEPIASVGWKQLFVAAANSFEIRASVVSLYVFYQILGRGPLKPWRDQTIHSITKYAQDHPGLANLTIVVVAALLFFWFFSIAVFIATFARFRLRRKGRLALIEHGLLTRRWRTVLLPRVQAISFVESPAQQLMRDGALRMTLPGSTRNSLERTMLLPSVPRSMAIGVLDRLFTDLYPQIGGVLHSFDESMHRLPPSALRSYLLRWVWRLIPISIILGWLFYEVPGGFGPLWGLAPLVLLGPIGAILGFIRFRDAGWWMDEQGRLVVRERGLSRITRVTNRERLIWMRVSRLRFFSGRNVMFIASVAGAGARPGILSHLIGYGLVSRGDSRFRVRGLLDTEAHQLTEACARHRATSSASSD